MLSLTAGSHFVQIKDDKYQEITDEEINFYLDNNEEEKYEVMTLDLRYRSSINLVNESDTFIVAFQVL